MNKLSPVFFLFAFFLSACGVSAAPPTVTVTPIPPTATMTLTPAPPTPFMTVTPACISSAPSEDDIQRGLRYTGQILPAPYWAQSHTVEESYVAVTHQNESNGALVYIEVRVKPCGYDEPDLNRDFDDENWQATFANYDSYQPIVHCRTERGLRLYQFKAWFAAQEYQIYYWAQNDTDHRVITLMMIFPAEEFAVMSAYAAHLFPDLPNCS